MGLRTILPPDRDVIVETVGDAVDAALKLVDDFPYDGHAVERRTRIGTRRITFTIAISEP